MRENSWRPWQSGQSTPLPGLARVIGHRGAAARAPENTLAGLRAAHALGATWVEFDVMLSRDEVPVLIHDETLERTTDGHGHVNHLTAAELHGLDAGSRFGKDFTGEPVPTLVEAVTLLLELGLNANLEIKPASGCERRTGEVVAELLGRIWPAHAPRLLLSSFERDALQPAQARLPSIPRGLLATTLPADWAEAMQRLECTTLHLDHNWLSPAMLRTLTDAQVPVLLYTVNSAQRAHDLLAGGAVAVFSDVPDLLLADLAAQ